MKPETKGEGTQQEPKWDRLEYYREIHKLDLAALERYRIRLLAGMDKIEAEYKPSRYTVYWNESHLPKVEPISAGDRIMKMLLVLIDQMRGTDYEESFFQSITQEAKRYLQSQSPK